MISTRTFLAATTVTVISRPSLYGVAFKLYGLSRARNARGIKKYLPSSKYLRFRIYTQYGNEDVEKPQIKKDIIHYLQWLKLP